MEEDRGDVIIHPRIASGDIYTEVVGLRAAKTPALKTLKIHRASDPFLNVAEGLHITDTAK